jgi:hypothetical protein
MASTTLCFPLPPSHLCVDCPIWVKSGDTTAISPLPFVQSLPLPARSPPRARRSRISARARARPLPVRIWPNNSSRGARRRKLAAAEEAWAEAVWAAGRRRSRWSITRHGEGGWVFFDRNICIFCLCVFISVGLFSCFVFVRAIFL